MQTSCSNWGPQGLHQPLSLNMLLKKKRRGWSRGGKSAWKLLLRNQEKVLFRRGFLLKCTPLLAVALCLPDVLLARISLGIFVSLGMILDSAETPFTKTPLFLVPELQANAPEKHPLQMSMQPLLD